MKKLTALLLAALFCTTAAEAQDLIVKRDSTRVEANVSEIAPETVRYKRFSNPDGPTYVVPVAEIAYIRFRNGETERFVSAAPAAPAAIPATPLTPATPVRTETPAAPARPAEEARPEAGQPETEYVVRRYEIGEYYERGDVRGVVCKLTDDATHGLILSLDEIYLPWCAAAKADLKAVGADAHDDGEINMQTVARYIEANGLSWSDFPAFEWCRAKGEGWYLPAIDELLTVGHSFNGGSRLKYNRKARSHFNDVLVDHGGKRLNRLVYYYASTEENAASALTSHMAVEPPYMEGIVKNAKFLVRAVRKF